MFEIVGEIAIDFFLILLRWTFDERFEYLERRRSKPNHFSYVGIVLVAGLLGYLFHAVIPQKLLPKPSVPGVSLVVSPLAVGLLARARGNYRQRRGRDSTVLATFWGGALFAFTVALVRWLRVA